MKSSQILLTGGISVLFAFALILGGCNDDAKKGAEQPATTAQPAAAPAESKPVETTAPATSMEAAPPLKEGETPEVKEPIAPVENAEGENAPVEGEPKPQ